MACWPKPIKALADPPREDTAPVDPVLKLDPCPGSAVAPPLKPPDTPVVPLAIMPVPPPALKAPAPPLDAGHAPPDVDPEPSADPPPLKYALPTWMVACATLNAPCVIACAPAVPAASFFLPPNKTPNRPAPVPASSMDCGLAVPGCFCWTCCTSLAAISPSTLLPCSSRYLVGCSIPLNSESNSPAIFLRASVAAATRSALASSSAAVTRR